MGNDEVTDRLVAHVFDISYKNPNQEKEYLFLIKSTETYSSIMYVSLTILYEIKQ